MANNQKKRPRKPGLRTRENAKNNFQQNRKHQHAGLLCPSCSEMNFWTKFAKTEIPSQFGFELPVVLVKYLITSELENVLVRQTAPVRQQEIVACSLLRAARAYEAMIDRAVERGNEDFPNGGIPHQEFRTMVEKAVHDAINDSHTALHWAPLGIDLFSDVIWPQAKKLLAGRYDWLVSIETDDDQRYHEWLRKGDF